MRTSKKRILFFSNGDSTRSRMAEGFFRAWADPQVEAVSTAVQAEAVNPYVEEVMHEVSIDISGQKARTVKDSFQQHFMCVVAICEFPRERCPIWPFTRNIFQWHVANPGGSKEKFESREMLRRVRDEIGSKVKEFIQTSLPALQSGAIALTAK